MFALEELKIDKSLEDEKLVALIIQSKSAELFSVIYDRYSEIVYHKCLSFVKNKEEAQDLAHDIFVKLFVKLKMFNFKSKFSTWVYSFTYNHCVNYVQREQKKRRDKFLIADDLGNYSKEVEEIDEEVIFSMKADKLQKSLELINPTDKMILFMKYQDDLSIEDIQNALGIGKSAVKMRLSRAKERLVKIYNDF
ncbi:RNA polymerase sigma-70 factor [Tamlana sedimentorum]|uniref:RNA polymerase sigma-70 factor n=1 Tax=Neotamlana sedimentorum TaxID=1435349 RepID=A0A0D7WCF7_9FLAO|nr:RNA polymerase sigma-70 factor [Tamlana sedimentorum]